MSGETAAIPAVGGVTPRAVEWRRDRLFFGGMALATAVTVFAGFAPSYFLRGLSDQPPLSPLIHIHGIVFTSWIVLFVVQASLVAAKRTDIHRRLGIAGVLVAILMLVVGFLAATSAAARGLTPPGGPPPLVFLSIPLGDLVTFAVLFGAGMLRRRAPATHKRLMLLATIALLPPAIARLTLGAGPLAFFGLTDLFVIAMLFYDRLSRGRFHPATLWGGLFLVLLQPLRLLFAETALWMAFATWATG